MPPKVHCLICLEDVDISKISLYPTCGHGFCKACVEITFRQTRPKCALCRLPVHESIPLFLNLVDSVRSDAEATVEGLNKMDADAKLISVQRGANRIQKVVKNMHCGDDIANSLQRAIDDFRTRIIPNFSKVEEQAKEMAALRERLLHAQQDVRSLQNVEQDSLKKDEELAVLRSEIKTLQKDSEQAVSLAESMTGEMLQLRQRSESAQQEKAKLEEDNQRLRTMLDRQSKNAHAQNTKIKALKREIASLQAHNVELESSQTIEESLIVDDHQERYSFRASSPLSTRLSSIEPDDHAVQRSSDRSSAADRDYEGMPGPGFSSDWKMNFPPDRSTLKRKASALKPTTNLPIAVDTSGRPRLQVQTGPIRSRRAP